jgi:predicted nucleotidyltransferase
MLTALMDKDKNMEKCILQTDFLRYIITRCRFKEMIVKNKKSIKRNSSAVKGQIKKITKRIVSRFEPEKIILFGSFAQGKAGPDSDIDLLVIMPVAGSKRKKAVEIGVELHDINVAKDVVVVRPEEFEWRKDIVGTIEWPAAHKGKILYERT